MKNEAKLEILKVMTKATKSAAAAILVSWLVSEAGGEHVRPDVPMWQRRRFDAHCVIYFIFFLYIRLSYKDSM